MVPGNDVADLRRRPDFPSNPTTSVLLPVFEIPQRYLGSVGNRLRATLRPPVSGDYTFWISGATSAELRLAPEDPDAAPTLLARLPNETEERQWDRYPEQKSSPIRLEAGAAYAVEVLHKVSECCGDRLAVAWEGPGIAFQILPGSVLSAPGGLPTVKLTAPREGARLADHADLVLRAEASSTSNRISEVRFYVAGVQPKRVGASATPP